MYVCNRQFGNTETEKGPGRERRHERGKHKSYGCERDDSTEAVILHKMATFREARESFMFAYQDGSIDDTDTKIAPEDR